MGEKSFYVEQGRLKVESFTKTRSESGYWLLGYRAEFPDGHVMSVGEGEVDIVGGEKLVRNEGEARTYIGVLERARRAAEWNGDEPQVVWSHDQAVEAIHVLVEWAKTGTSSRDLSHHGIPMGGRIIVGGFPVRMCWSGLTNAFYAYEKHHDLPDIVRRPWELASPGPEAREVVERAGLTVKDEWNGNRSMVVDIEMHPSVRAAFQPHHDKKRAIGGPLEGAPERPQGWVW